MAYKPYRKQTLVDGMVLMASHLGHIENGLLALEGAVGAIPDGSIIITVVDEQSDVAGNALPALYQSSQSVILRNTKKDMDSGAVVYDHYSYLCMEMLDGDSVHVFSRVDKTGISMAYLHGDGSVVFENVPISPSLLSALTAESTVDEIPSAKAVVDYVTSVSLGGEVPVVTLESIGAQAKLTGTKGQLVGFDDNGNAIATDAPLNEDNTVSLPSGAHGQYIGFDEGGAAAAINPSTALSASSTNDELPTAKAVVDYVASVALGEDTSAITPNSIGAQARLIGTQGQMVGFDADGNAVAQDMPEGSAEAVQAHLDAHTANTDLHVTAEEKALWSAGGNALSVTTITLAADGWSEGIQIATVSGIAEDELSQIIDPVPAAASIAGYYSAGILATVTAVDTLSFSAAETPTEDLTVYVVVQSLTGSSGGTAPTVAHKWERYSLNSSAEWTRVTTLQTEFMFEAYRSYTIVTSLDIVDGVFTAGSSVKESWTYLDTLVPVYFGVIGNYSRKGVGEEDDPYIYTPYDEEGYNTFGNTYAYRFDSSSIDADYSTVIGNLYRSEIINSKGTFIELMYSDDETAYPENGIQDGYWFIKVA